MPWVYFAAVVLVSWLGALVCAYLYGRRLRRYLDDPLLDERLAQHRGKLFVITLIASVADLTALQYVFHFEDGPVYFMASAIGLLLLNGLAVQAGAFPTRRVLYQEQWTFFEFAGHQLRFLTALLGFWLGLILAPGLVYLAGSWRWAAAAGFCVLLAVYSYCYQWLLLRVLRARPLDDATLLEAFEPIMARSQAARPIILESGSSRGGFVNAFALPSTRQSRVLFGRRLLDILDTEEAAAIFAHEVAHLEQFDAAKLRQVQLREWLLIALACFLAPVGALVDVGLSQFVMYGWPPFILFWMVLRQKRHQHLEVGGDTRAVELCGNPEALIRGLIKLHVYTHAPRRLAHEVESMISHPSLARRIQLIRQHARQLAPEAAAEPPAGQPASIPPAPAPAESWCEVFTVADCERERLVFEPERILWITLSADAVAALPEQARTEELCARAESFQMSRYASLVELRMALDRKGPMLRAVDINRQLTEKRLRPDDAARAKHCLDRVDEKLASLNEVNSFSSGSARLAGALVGLASFMALNEDVMGIGITFWVMIACLGALSKPQRA
ncbi:MAG: M48 family metalloprotease, partial [Gemmataceae bacterium]